MMREEGWDFFIDNFIHPCLPTTSTWSLSASSLASSSRRSARSARHAFISDPVQKGLRGRSQSEWPARQPNHGYPLRNTGRVRSPACRRKRPAPWMTRECILPRAARGRLRPLRSGSQAAGRDPASCRSMVLGGCRLARRSWILRIAPWGGVGLFRSACGLCAGGWCAPCRGARCQRASGTSAARDFTMSGRIRTQTVPDANDMERGRSRANRRRSARTGVGKDPLPRPARVSKQSLSGRSG